jgi:hypothetical protein
LFEADETLIVHVVAWVGLGDQVRRLLRNAGGAERDFGIGRDVRGDRRHAPRIPDTMRK